MIAMAGVLVISHQEFVIVKNNTLELLAKESYAQQTALKMEIVISQLEHAIVLHLTLEWIVQVW